MRDDAWTQGAYLAEFTDFDTFADAAADLSQRGYRRIESYSPYRAPEVEQAIGHHRSVLPMLVFGGGAVGAVVGYAIQYWTNVVSYPQNMGARPTHAVPAFIVPTFEGAILVAGLTAFFGLLFILRLPRPWHPVFEIDGFERSSIDRFWLAIDARDQRSDPEATPRELAALHAVRVVHMEPIA